MGMAGKYDNLISEQVAFTVLLHQVFSWEVLKRWVENDRCIIGSSNET